jgi:hypothetical protein
MEQIRDAKWDINQNSKTPTDPPRRLYSIMLPCVSFLENTKVEREFTENFQMRRD